MTLFFNWAQTFYFDKSAVKNATEVAITRVDLYFRAKPPATNNKSGIDSPGVELLIVPTLNGIPIINQLGAYRPTEPTEHGAKFAFYSGGQTARVEYEQIQGSTNASAPTIFLFDNPIFVATDKEYAILVKFDGNENFILWSSQQGETLVGTDRVSPGPSGKFIGQLFQYIDDPNKQYLTSDNVGYGYSNAAIDPTTSDNTSVIQTSSVTSLGGWDTNYLQANWAPIPQEDLKFKVHVARYFENGQYVATLRKYWANALLTTATNRSYVAADSTSVLSNNVIRLTAPCQTSEYVTFDVKSSIKDDMMYGEPVYQDGPLYPGGRETPLQVTLAPSITGANSEFTSRIVQANGSYLLDGGKTFQAEGGWNNIVGVGSLIVLEANGENMIRSVAEIVSNTQILVDLSFDQTESANVRITPIAYIQDISKSFVLGRYQDLLTLYNSTASEEIRFVGKTIENITLDSEGTGYSNSDYIRVSGYEDIDFAVKGNYPALANIVTDASGNITAVYISNSGAGFVNSSLIAGANIEILQSNEDGTPTEAASTGTGATFVFDVGANIKSAFTNTVFKECEIVNLECARMKPEITVNNPLGSVFSLHHRTLYHYVKDANTFNGKAYYIDTESENANTDIIAKIFKSHSLKQPSQEKVPVLPSRSNEYVIRFANGAENVPNTQGIFFSNAAVFLIDISSNNDYQAVFFDPEIVNSHYAKYIINNNYTDEHTNYGYAWAKHVMTKMNFAVDRVAEDVLVYLTAYRPANTDIKVYARVHNSKDDEAFDDKDWTLLEEIDGIGVYSSRDNSSDYIELTYGLPAYPNTDFTANGSVTLTQGNAHVIGDESSYFEPRVIINDAGTGYTNGDIIQWVPAAQDSPVLGIYAHYRSANASGTVTTDAGGNITSVAITSTGYGFQGQTNAQTIYVTNSTYGSTGGSGANVYYVPGLQTNDVVKIYSPYIDWANTNYTLAVVNSVISNTEFTVKRTFGELSANLSGVVDVNTTSSTIVGTGTTFDIDFTEGDFVIIWSNSSVHESHEVLSITNNTVMVLDSNVTFANTGAAYAYVTPDSFINTSLNVASLKIDRLAYEHQAWNNIQNDNVARYYSKSKAVFDGYDTVQLKIVLLSDSDIVVPKVDDTRGVMVSA